MENRLIDISEASDLLGVPKSTIYDWTHKKIIPHYKIGQSLRFNPVEILEHFRCAPISPTNMPSIEPLKDSLIIEKEMKMRRDLHNKGGSNERK